MFSGGMLCIRIGLCVGRSWVAFPGGREPLVWLRSREVTGSVVRRVFQLAGIGWARARRSYSYSSASYSGESLGLCPYWVIVC